MVVRLLKESPQILICFYEPVEEFFPSESWFNELLENFIEFLEMNFDVFIFDFCDNLGPSSLSYPMAVALLVMF